MALITCANGHTMDDQDMPFLKAPLRDATGTVLSVQTYMYCPHCFGQFASQWSTFKSKLGVVATPPAPVGVL